MGIEKYVAIASLGLFIMFVGEILTVYYFMIDAPTDIIGDPIRIDPEPKIYQFISIGIAPALVLLGLSYLMARQYGSKPIGFMIIASGVILLIGMIIAYTLLEQLEKVYLITAVTVTPLIFAAVSIAVIIVGVTLLKQKKRRPKKEYF